MKKKSKESDNEFGELIQQSRRLGEGGFAKDSLVE